MEIMQYSIYNSSDLGASDCLFLEDLGDVGQVHTNHQVGILVSNTQRLQPSTFASKSDIGKRFWYQKRFW